MCFFNLILNDKKCLLNEYLVVNILKKDPLWSINYYCYISYEWFHILLYFLSSLIFLNVLLNWPYWPSTPMKHCESCYQTVNTIIVIITSKMVLFIKKYYYFNSNYYSHCTNRHRPKLKTTRLQYVTFLDIPRTDKRRFNMYTFCFNRNEFITNSLCHKLKIGIEFLTLIWHSHTTRI